MLGCGSHEKRRCAWTCVSSFAVAGLGCSALFVRARARSVHGLLVMHGSGRARRSAHERGREDPGAGCAAQGGEECRPLCCVIYRPKEVSCGVFVLKAS
eukprot:5838110-Prymnesium_polylepis.2